MVLENGVVIHQPNSDNMETFSDNIHAAPWKEYFLMNDPETEITVKIVHHPKGNMTPWHKHPCAHGDYVLEGTMRTNFGDFGPGSFLWFPEGVEMEHGATEDEDVTFLFISNKHFEMIYVDKETGEELHVPATAPKSE